MQKKLISALAVIVTIVMSTFSIYAADADTRLRKGDTIQYTFTVGECPNMAGISVDSFYSEEYLTLSGEPEFLVDGQGMTNTNKPGKVRWHTIISGGRAFSDDDILVETFIVKKGCTLADAALSFECTEIFDNNMQLLSAEIISARVDIIETGTDEDDTETETDKRQPTDTDTGIDSEDGTDAQPPSEVESKETYPVKPVTVSSTDLTTSEEDIDPTPSKTVSRRAASSRISVTPTNPISTESKNNTSSKIESSKSDSSMQESSKPESASAAETSSVKSEAAVSSENVSAEVSEIVSSQKTSSAAASSGGRIAIALTAAVIAAACIAVILAKVLKTAEE